MNKIVKLCVAVAMLSGSTVMQAGGLLTNTNQNIMFLRNPARDGAIGIDGIYTNPAGVAFLSDGWHLSLNWQYAHQTRTITTAYGPLFATNVKNPAPLSSDGFAYRKFKGVADAPVLPSIQAAYNKGKWSFQGGFAVSGGGGKCEFEDGLGSFEGLVAGLAHQLGMSGYSLDTYERGKQFYFGLTLGAAYKVTPNFSVFGGARVLYGMAKYSGHVSNIMVTGQATGGNLVPATDVFAGLKSQAAAAAEQYAQAGMAEQAAQYAATAQQMGAYEEVTKGIFLNCNQNGLGIAPYVGVDWKLGRLNLAAKFDFKVRMRLKTENNDQRFNTIAAAVPMLQKFADGNVVSEDSPALFTIGAQYDITDRWRVMGGYHRFFDVDCPQYYGNTLGDTQEFNFGTEYDITKKIQVSAGMQKTNYDMDDEFMNDISFCVSSYSFGFGVGVQVSPKVKLNAAYFQTNYDTMNVTSEGGTVKNAYTRTNRVLGLGCDINF